MTNCPTWKPPVGEGNFHRVHRPKKNRNGKFVLGNQMFGKKLKSKKAIIEQVTDEEIDEELKSIK